LKSRASALTWPENQGPEKQITRRFENAGFKPAFFRVGPVVAPIGSTKATGMAVARVAWVHGHKSKAYELNSREIATQYSFILSATISGFSFRTV